MLQPMAGERQIGARHKAEGHGERILRPRTAAKSGETTTGER